MKVFITGASSGIGKAIATEYAKRHKNKDTIIGLVARRSEYLQKLQNILQQTYKVKCVIFPLDVRDSDALSTAATDFIQQYGTPDVTIACAGVSRQLVGIASVAGIRGLPGAGAYSASKAATISYLESLRVEMARDNITVTTIAPGYIRTPMTDVNQYKMPFLMDADVFAHKFVNAVENKRRFIVIPWQMGWVSKILRLIPPFLWDFAMKKAPYKKRLDWDWL